MKITDNFEIRTERENTIIEVTDTSYLEPQIANICKSLLEEERNIIDLSFSTYTNENYVISNLKINKFFTNKNYEFIDQFYDIPSTEKQEEIITTLLTSIYDYFIQYNDMKINSIYIEVKGGI